MIHTKAQARIEHLKQKTATQNTERYALPPEISLEALLQGLIVDVIDARKLKGFFLPTILAKARFLKARHVLLVRQNFEPTPLYSVLGKMGFVYHTQNQEGQYLSYFIRKKDLTLLKKGDDDAGTVMDSANVV